MMRRTLRSASLLWRMPRERRVPFLPPEELAALRDARVRETVRYAAATVPYYQRLFADSRIDPDEIRTAGDLARLPILEKEVVRRSPERFVSTAPRARDAVLFATSGSTGEPLHIYRDRRSLAENSLFSFRERDVRRAVCGKAYLYRELGIRYTLSTVNRIRDFAHSRFLVPLRLPRLQLSVVDPVDRVIEAMNAFRPDVVRSYGSYLETLFRTLAARGAPIHLPKLLIFGGDGMTDGGRQFIEEHFGIPVHGSYNAVEAFKIGFYCERRRGYHLHDDLCHVRIVDDGGKTVPDGERGHVIISNLVNRGTVLLNYRLGDLAVRSPEPCDCGRGLPLLSSVEGRTEDIVFLGDGDFVHPRAIWGVFKPHPEILRYQLVQHAADRFELSLVTSDPASYEGLVGDVVADLRVLLGPDSIIEPRFRTELGPTGSVKFRPVVALPRSRAWEAEDARQRT